VLEDERDRHREEGRKKLGKTLRKKGWRKREESEI
jgi:hypothetical protein